MPISIPVIYAILPFCTVIFQDDPAEVVEPKSASAIKAKSDMLDSLKKIEEEHSKKLKLVQEKYLAGLDEARKLAVEKNDIDEAQRIVIAKRTIEDEIKNEESPGYGFKIHSARWGAKSKWVDVTAQVRKMVSNSRFTCIPEKVGFHDPIFGTEKSLVVVYSINSKVGVSIAGYDQLMVVPPQSQRRR